MATRSSWWGYLRRSLVPAAILVFLALIAFVRFGHLMEKTREGTTIGHLDELRQAILLYYQDHNGVFPRELSPEGPFGRYLREVPEVESLHPSDGAPSPAGNQVTYGTQTPEGYGRGWYYNYESGQIFVNSIGRDSRGVPYSSY